MVPIFDSCRDPYHNNLHQFCYYAYIRGRCKGINLVRVSRRLAAYDPCLSPRLQCLVFVCLFFQTRFFAWFFSYSFFTSPLSFPIHPANLLPCRHPLFLSSTNSSPLFASPLPPLHSLLSLLRSSSLPLRPFSIPVSLFHTLRDYVKHQTMNSSSSNVSLGCWRMISWGWTCPWSIR